MADEAALTLRLAANITALERQLDKARAKVGETAKGFSDNFNKSNRSVTDNLARSGAEIAKFGQLTNNQKFIIRDFSYQISDMAVQIGSGQGVMRALGQQLPQLLGPMGILGAALGAVAAIAIPVAAGLASMSGAGKTLKDNVDDLTKMVDAYAASADKASLPTEDLAKKYGTATEAARHFLEALRDIDQVKALDAVQKTVASLQTEIGRVGSASGGDVLDVENRLNGYVARLKEIRANPGQDAAGNIKEQLQLAQSIRDAMALSDQIDHVASSMNISRDAAKQVLSALADLKNASGVEQTWKAADNLRAAMLAAYNSVEKMPPAVLELYNKLSASGDKMAELQGKSEGAGNAIATAAARARELRDALADALKSAASIANQSAVGKQEAELRLKYKDDPVKLAGVLKGLEVDRATTLPGGAQLPDGAKAQIDRDRAQAVRDAEAQARDEQALANSRKSDRAGASASTKYAGKMDSLFDFADNQVAQAQMQLDMIGKTDRQVAVLQARYELLARAKQRNLDLDRVDASSGQTLREEINARADALADLRVKVEQAGAQEQFWADQQHQLTDGILDAIVAGKDFGAVLGDMAQQLEKAALQAALFGSGPLGSLFGMPAGKDGKGGGLLGAALGAIGFRADGGPVQAGQPYIVGEKRPELFVPGSSGRIVPRVPQMVKPREMPTASGSRDGRIHITSSFDETTGSIQQYVEVKAASTAARLIAANNQKNVPSIALAAQRTAQRRPVV